MPEITNYRNGAILNAHHGVESESGLKIRLEGLGTYGHPVEVNGVRAEMDGRHFPAEVELRKKINEVTVSELTPYGRFSQELTLVWDKKSFKRYGFFIDDHSFLFTDLTKERPKHAFDHFYQKHLKHLNEKYGLKVTLNCFFRNDHEPFTLDLMPDIWKSEFHIVINHYDIGKICLKLGKMDLAEEHLCEALKIVKMPEYQGREITDEMISGLLKSLHG